MATQESHINRFNGGMEEDKRALPFYRGNQIQNTDKFSITKNFDTYTYPHKLVPYNNTVSNESKALKIVKFLYAPWLSAGAFRLYGFGVSSGTIPAVYIYDIDGGITTWGTPNNNASAVSARNEEVFFYYKQFIYMWTGGNNLVRFDTTVAAAFNDAYQTIAYTNVAQPVHHSADDCAYFFTDNLVHRLNDTTWSGSVLTLPSNIKITSATAYGNYLAIACSTLGSLDKKSTVFLWDRDSSLTTLSNRIDFGEGEIVHLVCLDNKLIAVMNFYLNNLYSNSKGKCIIKQVNGNFATPLNTITTDTYSGVIPAVRTVKDNKLYFAMSMPLQGDTRYGIWVLDSSGKMTLDFLKESATSYQGIFRTGNTWWLAHSNDGSVDRSHVYGDAGTGYTNTAIYESMIFNGGDIRLKKKLIGATLTTEPLPSGATIELYYRKDEETSWTLIFANSTLNSISHSAINIESTQANLPEFKEIQWRIESTGGAVFTGWKWKWETLEKDIY